MSFKCEICSNVEKRPVKFISKKREKLYPNTDKKGWEIIEEEYLCKHCADKKAESPQVLIEVKPPTRKYLVSEPVKRARRTSSENKNKVIQE